MSKKLQNNLLVIFIGISVLIANLWHVISQWIANPPDRYFTWIAHYYGDYFLYVSQIAQGVYGNWIFASHLYTNEPLPATWVYWPNVLMGKIGSILTRSPFVLYNGFLILLVILLLWLVWRVICAMFPKQQATQIVAFLFFVTASNFANIRAFLTRGSLELSGNTWFSPTPALNRLGGVPHQILQTILLITILYLFSRLPTIIPTTNPTKKIMAIAFIALCFLTATLSPIQMVLVCFVFIVTVLIEKNVFMRIPRILVVGAGLGAAWVGAYLVNRAFDTSQLFAAAKLWEKSQSAYPSITTFLWAMGPMIFFIPMGLKEYRKKHSTLKTVVFLYGAFSLLAFFSPIPRLLGTNNVRWIHPASYMAFPLLASIGLTELSRFLSRYFARTSRPTPRVSQKKLYSLFVFLFTLSYLFLTVPALLVQIHARSGQDTATVLYGNLNHVPLPVISAMEALHSLPEKNVVLTDPTLPYDVLVPIMTNKPSYTGHLVHTLYLEQKGLLRQQFFQGDMTNTRARQFLSNHCISYILTTTPGPLFLRDNPIFHAIHTNNTLTVYNVKL